MRSRIPRFSLTPEGDLTTNRMVSLRELRELDLHYFVSVTTNYQIDLGALDLRQLELAVAREARDSFLRRCESETLRQRSRKHSDPPEICSRYERLNARLSGRG